MSNNTIPNITHPLGKGWRQPSTDKILIDDTHALMEKPTFDQLAEYSSSMPTGVYEGKMWKAYQGSTKTWWLCWFGESEDPDQCSNNFRKILLV